MFNLVNDKGDYGESLVLRHQMDDLMIQARQNEKKLRRFQSLELRLIGLNSLYELIEAVIYPDYTTYKWDKVTLLLLDPEYEIRRILEEEGVDLNAHPTLMFASTRDALESLYPMSLFPLLGAYKASRHAGLFYNKRRAPSSVALLPLVRHGKLIGSLNIGSNTRDRFIKNVRTDFFEHLAAIVAICLENAANLERLKRQGLTDTLTATNNRRFFDQRLNEEIESSRRTNKILSCMLLDIDYFKQVNDNYGHQIGDQVLREVAELIRAQLRGSDVLSRYGGEEFAVLLSHTDEKEALEVAQRIRESIEQNSFKNDTKQKFDVTISIGVALFNQSMHKKTKQVISEILIGQADKALYDAKAQGRNCVISCGEV